MNDAAIVLIVYDAAGREPHRRSAQINIGKRILLLSDGRALGIGGNCAELRMRDACHERHRHERCGGQQGCDGPASVQVEPKTF